MTIEAHFTPRNGLWTIVIDGKTETEDGAVVYYDYFSKKKFSDGIKAKYGVKISRFVKP